MVLLINVQCDSVFCFLLPFKHTLPHRHNDLKVSAMAALDDCY